MYKRELPNSATTNFICLKGVGEINAPATMIKDAIKDISWIAQWDPLYLEGLFFFPSLCSL